jgi:hypothetical protein
MDVLTRLGNRASNLNVDLSQLAKKDESESSATSTDSEIENEIFKTQDKYMSDIKEKIDVYKIETMKLLSKGEYDQVEARPDAKAPNDKAKKALAAEKYFQKNKNPVNMKISKFHKWFLRMESLATKNNILVFIVGLCLFTVFVLPFLLYSWSVVDRHYFGLFHEPVAIFAKTTNEKMYYMDQGIPFVTIQDIYAERDHHYRRLAKGHPTYYQMYR